MFAFFFIKTIFALLSMHETCVYVSVTISCNFKFTNTYGIDQITTLLWISILFKKYNTKNYNFYKENYWNIFFFWVSPMEISRVVNQLNSLGENNWNIGGSMLN